MFNTYNWCRTKTKKSWHSLVTSLRSQHSPEIRSEIPMKEEEGNTEDMLEIELKVEQDIKEETEYNYEG